MDEPLAVTLFVARALEAVGAGYFIGGSLASGIYGPGRATMDADLRRPARGGTSAGLRRFTRIGFLRRH